MLTITSRTARLNQDYRGNSHEKDGQVTKQLFFGLDEIELAETELCAINGDALLYRGLYDTSKAQPVTILKGFKPLELEESIEGAAITVRLRGGTEFKFVGCTLTKIRVNTANAGAPLLSMKVETAPALDASLAELVAAMGELVDAEIHSGTTKTEQQDLPLNRHGEGEETDEHATRKSRKRNGSQVGAH